MRNMIALYVYIALLLTALKFILCIQDLKKIEDSSVIRCYERCVVIIKIFSRNSFDLDTSILKPKGLTVLARCWRCITIGRFGERAFRLERL